MWKQAQYLEMKENVVLSLQKYPFTRRSDEEKKGSRSLDQIAGTFSLFVPLKKKIAPAATVQKRKMSIDRTVNMSYVQMKV